MNQIEKATALNKRTTMMPVHTNNLGNHLVAYILIIFLMGCNAPPHATSIADVYEENEEMNDAIAPDYYYASKKANVLANVQNIGPYNTAGRCYCVLVDMADTSHLLAGSASGGLWKSTNSGYTWQPVRDDFFPMSVWAIEQNHFNAQEIYLSTNKRLFDNNGIEHPDLMLSTDGGNTFNYINANLNIYNITEIAQDKNDSDKLYVSVDKITYSEVYRYRKTAGTFQLVSSVQGNRISELKTFPSGKVMYAAANKVYQSATGDSGTFVNTSTGLSPFIGLDAKFDYCASQPDIIYLILDSASNVEGYKSVDGGNTWSPTGNFMLGTFGGVVAVKPDNPDVVVIGAVGMYCSINGGATFTHWQALGVDFWDIDFNPLNSNYFYLANDGGIGIAQVWPFNSNAFAVQFSRDSLLINQQIYHGDFHPTANDVLAGYQDLGTKLVKQNGTHINNFGNDGSYCYFNNQLNGHAYLSYQRGVIYSDSNYNTGALNFNNIILNELDTNNDFLVDDGTMFIHPYAVSKKNGAQLYYPTNKRVWRSTNLGNNWTPITNAIANKVVTAFAFSEVNSPTVFMARTDSLIVVPNANTATPGSEHAIVLQNSVSGLFTHPHTDSIVFSKRLDGIYKSSNVFNSNVTWTKFTALPDSIARCIVIDSLDTNFIAIGTLAGLYISTDGGATFALETSLPPVIINQLIIRNSDRKLFIQTYGRGTWIADLPAYNASTIENNANSWCNIFASEPSGVTVTVYDQSAAIEFDLYNLQGGRVHSQQINKGTATIPCSHLAKGVYVCKVSARGRASVIKKVLID